MSITEKLLSAPKLWERENDIIQWGVDRNIIGYNAQATFESQQEKTRQEWEEWRRDHTMDDCGDLFVTLVMGAALKGFTVSECVGSCDFRDPLGLYREDEEESSEEQLLDEMITDYLEDDSSDHILLKMNIAYIVHVLIMNTNKRGWTLEECIETAWEDIKDRKGKMLYGMFIKQKDLNSLSELGVEVVEDDGEVYFEGLVFSDYCMRKLNGIFDLLSLDYTKEGSYEQGVYIKTTERI